MLFLRIYYNFLSIVKLFSSKMISHFYLDRFNIIVHFSCKVFAHYIINNKDSQYTVSLEFSYQISFNCYLFTTFDNL